VKPHLAGLRPFTENEAMNGGDLQRRYSGYLIVGPITEEVVLNRLTALAKVYPILDVSPTSVEIEYIGRDERSEVVRALLALAEIVKDAKGEIECEVSGDTDELWFEYYHIRDGRLFRQRAELRRLPDEEEVTERDLHS
jgi:hypothetical protein